MRFGIEIFDHTDNLAPSVADAVCRCEVEGQTRGFLLRVVDGFVYFSPAPQEDYDPVFGMIDRLPHRISYSYHTRPHLLCRWFEHEFIAGKCGLFTFDKHYLCYRWPWEFTPEASLVFYLWQPTGTVFLRPWWAQKQRLAVPWEGENCNSTLRWIDAQRYAIRDPEDWQVRTDAFKNGSDFWSKRPTTHLTDLWKKSQMVTPSRVEIERGREKWIRGNRAELRNVMQWFIHSFWDKFECEDAIVWRFACGTPLGGHYLWVNNTTAFANRGFLHWMPKQLIDDYLEFIENYFIATGWRLTPNGELGYDHVGFWISEPITYEQQVAPPSYHDRLEAPLRLNEWMWDVAQRDPHLREDVEIIIG